MTDLHTRFKTLDSLSTPNLWHDIEERAMATRPTRRSSAWVLIAVTLLLVLAIGGAVLVGSGIIKLPVTVDASASPSAPSPSSSAQESIAASSSPVVQVPASWTATGSLIEARSDHTATLLPDDKVLVAGGADNFAVLASAELYDPSSGSWTATGDMIEGRLRHTATLLLDGKVLVAGGSSSGGSGPSLASAELYDPKSGSWMATENMIEARAHHTATLLPDGRVLVAGGSGSDPSGFDSLASAEVYDPGSGTWTAAGSMAEIRVAHTATLLRDGEVLVAGGFNSGGALASAELYDPSSGTWTATGSMGAGRAKYTATLLPDGRVLAVGLGALASAELYDPGSGAWTATENMVADHVIHTATLLLDGNVLVAGGSSRGDNPELLAFAELFDPGSGAWTATENMVTPRDGHSATLLRGGALLVAGGQDHIGPDRLASAELYDPGSGP